VNRLWNDEYGVSSYAGEMILPLFRSHRIAKFGGQTADLAIRSEQMWRGGPSAAVVPSRSEEDSHVNVAAEETEVITVSVEEEPTPFKEDSHAEYRKNQCR